MIQLATFVVGFGLLGIQIFREEYRILEARYNAFLTANSIYPPVRPV